MCFGSFRTSGEKKIMSMNQKMFRSTANIMLRAKQTGEQEISRIARELNEYYYNMEA